MQLLVSVRSAAEVADALAGGADIVDAKEPARGALGQVEPEVLAEIARSLPAPMPLSVALGDAASVDATLAAVHALAPSPGAARWYVKLGFAGLRDEAILRAALAAAVTACAKRSDGPRVVAVAYADYDCAGSPRPTAVADAAAEAGAAGVLLDTWTKDGRDLFAWTAPENLRQWVARVREAGMASAVAGSLRAGRVGMVAVARPDIVGVRGAVCRGGRGGQVEAEKVRLIKLAIYDKVVAEK